ncbi:MAG: DUF397 domain-containing protein [Streptosporangiales bacterium]|nr:DUF397 domain-containing protein [Streptosporangiales bacterium]
MNDLPQAIWRKASLSAHNGGCVEVAALHGSVGVRDSRRPEDGAHVVPAATFAGFLADVRGGRFSS